jgi:hypothetical protein
MFVFTSTAEVVNVANALGKPLKRLFWMYKPADCTFPLHGWLLTSEAILWFHKGDKVKLVDRKPYRHDCYVHRKVGHEQVEGHPTVKPLTVINELFRDIEASLRSHSPYIVAYGFACPTCCMIRTCVDICFRGLPKNGKTSSLLFL